MGRVRITMILVTADIVILFSRCQRRQWSIGWNWQTNINGDWSTTLGASGTLLNPPFKAQLTSYNSTAALWDKRVLIESQFLADNAWKQIKHECWINFTPFTTLHVVNRFLNGTNLMLQRREPDVDADLWIKPPLLSEQRSVAIRIRTWWQTYWWILWHRRFLEDSNCRYSSSFMALITLEDFQNFAPVNGGDNIGDFHQS